MANDTCGRCDGDKRITVTLKDLGGHQPHGCGIQHVIGCPQCDVQWGAFLVQYRSLIKMANDSDRQDYVDNDEGLHNRQQSSRQPRRAWIRENRALIDEVMTNAQRGRKPAHYLEYHHGPGCNCYSCRHVGQPLVPNA